MKGAEGMRWADLLKLRTRYQRSIHLERDASQAEWLDGYVLTPLVRSVAGRILYGLREGETSRAWSLTGPYGSGKSAFALFLSQVLSIPSAPAQKLARELLKEGDAQLHGMLLGKGGVISRGGFVPVVAVGERKSLEYVLLQALLNAAIPYFPRQGMRGGFLREVIDARDITAAGESVGAKRVVELFDQFRQRLAAREKLFKGVLIILDEAGKTLEYCASNPGKADIHVLQELAEAASRSGDVPLVLVVSLHQAFESYAGALTTAQRNEWAKVQGRFEDVVFQEASDQVIGLIGRALNHGDLPPHLSRELAPLLEATVSAVRPDEKKSGKHVVELLSAALPLHPLTALAIPALFRNRLAQNERSLFAFLSSSEPGGFQEFVAAPQPVDQGAGLFTLDRLYDYVANVFGPSLRGHLGKHWVTIDGAIRRLPADANLLDARLLKVIGLLGTLGDSAGLGASTDVLVLAAGAMTSSHRREVELALERLTTASMIVFRKYKNSYQLWEGSDLNVEELVAKAQSDMPFEGAVVARLQRTFRARPVVARRHMFETGTLRYFDVHFGDQALVESGLKGVSSRADGLICLVIPTSDSEADRLQRTLKDPATWLTLNTWEGGRPVLVVVPDAAESVRRLAVEVTAIEAVLTGTPQLRDDAVARRELRERLAEAEQNLHSEVAGLLGGSRRATWLHGGRELLVRSPRELAARVSTLCDEVFNLAPVIENELLNRDELSSAAAAARRALMQGMVEHGDQERLGFEGYPPEISMYRSFLARHGLHRQRQGRWQLVAPKAGEPGSIQPAYVRILKHLETHEGTRVTLAELYQLLRLPPFGIKEGAAPVLVLAALIEREEEIALYEEGVFVPKWTGPIIERLLRSPEKFSVQMFLVAGAREGFLKALVGQQIAAASVLGVTRLLVRQVQGLTDFAKNSKQLSPEAVAVRDAILRAREPGVLVFDALPQACGEDPLEAGGATAKKVDALVQKLKNALREIESHYDRLLGRIAGDVFGAFGLLGDDEVLRSDLAARSARLLPSVTDLSLKAFVMRLADDTLAFKDWLVSVGTLLGGKPPERWIDADSDQMRLNLGGLVRRFRHAEALAFAAASTSPSAAVSFLRLSVTRPGEDEVDRVLAVTPRDQATIDRLCADLRRLLESQSDLSGETIAAALATVATDQLKRIELQQEVGFN